MGGTMWRLISSSPDNRSRDRVRRCLGVLGKQILALSFFVIGLSNFANAQNVFCIGSGDWNDPTIWNGGVVPWDTDNVYIGGGYTVTVGHRFHFCASLHVGRGTTPPNGGTIVLPDSDCILQVEGDVVIGVSSGGAGVVSMAYGTTLFVGGALLVNNGSLAATGGTVSYTGHGNNQTITPIAYNNLALWYAPKTAGGPLTVSGFLWVQSFASLDLGSYSATVGGDWENDGTLIGGTGTVILNGSSVQQITNSAGSFNNLTLRGTGTKKAYSDLVVDGRFTLDSGTTYHVQPSYNTHLKGNVNVNGVLDLGSTTLWLDGAGPQDIPGGQTYGTLRLAGEVKTAMGPLTVDANLIVAADATLNPGSYSHHLKGNLNNDGTVHAGTGFITFDGTDPQFIRGSGNTTFNFVAFINSLKTAETGFTVNDELYLDGSSSFDAGGNTITVGGDWNNGGTFVPGTSTIVLNGTSPQTILRSPTFKNLTLLGGGTKTANSSISVDSTFIIGAGATFSTGAVTDFINGDWTMNGAFLANAGTIAFSGTHPQLITGSLRFNNVTVENDSGVRLLSLMGDSIRGALTFTNGRINLGNTDLTLEPSATVTGAAEGKCIVTSGTGRVRRQIQGGSSAGSFTFPIAPNKSSYNPVAIALRPDPSEPTETFNVRVEPLTNASIGFGTIDTSTCTWRVWTIDEGTVGGTRANLAFQWNYDEDGTNIGIDPASPVQTMAYLFVNLTGHYEPVDEAVGPPHLNNPIVAATLRYTTTSFGSYIVGNAVALPIQLASFTGMEIPNIGVRLNWRTISEINNYGFYIQRKSQTDSAWRELSSSFTSGHGTTNEPHDYSFLDSTATQGAWQYRLHQVDLNGTSHFFEPITVNVLTDVQEPNLPTEFALRQNFPNPFNPTTNIQFDLPGAEHATLKVYDIVGKELATLVNETRPAGRYNERFNASRLASGVYLYRLTTPSHSASKKLVVIR